MTLQEILDKLPKLKPNRRYWFVRTDGGALYEQFLDGGNIGIGWDKVTLEDISKSNTGDNTGIQILKEIVKRKYDEEQRPGYAVSQLIKFAYQIKKNDIVLIPSQSSQEISFGEVTETPASNDLNADYFIKRKSVKWLTSVSRTSLDPNLFRLMFSHHTISEADFYAEHIDKEINSFFIKGDRAHLVLGVQSKNDIKARELFEMGTLSLDILDEFTKEEKLAFDTDEINVKLNVQSPGLIELSGLDIGGIVLLGIILIVISGGGFEVALSDKFKLSLKTDGIIEKVRKFLRTNSKINTKKQLLEKHMKDLDIKDPEDLVKILKELDKE